MSVDPTAWLHVFGERQQSIPPSKSLLRSLHQPHHHHHLPHRRSSRQLLKDSDKYNGPANSTPGLQNSAIPSIKPLPPQLHTGVTAPYRLDLLGISNLPLPLHLSDTYITSQRSLLQLQIRISLFDAQSGVFFGNTWIGRETIDIHGDHDALAKSGTNDGSSRSMLSSKSKKKKVEGRKGEEKKKSHERCTDVEDSGSSESQDEGDSGDDEDNDDEGERRPRKNKSNGPFGSGRLSKGHGRLIGRKLDIDFGGQAAYFHTPITSPSVMAIIEYVLVVDRNLMNYHNNPGIKSSEKGDGENRKITHDYISAGWSFLPLHDTALGGVDLHKSVNAEGCLLSAPHKNEKGVKQQASRVEVFSGSPRVLLFLQKPQFSTANTLLLPNPQLTRLPGCIITLRTSVEHGAIPLTYLWPENYIIGTGDHIPGLGIRQISGLQKWKIPKTVNGVVSKLRVSLYPDVESFEDLLLSRIATTFDQAHPTAVLKDREANPHSPRPLPTILERRIHVGLHNTYTFLFPPHVTTLRPPNIGTTNHRDPNYVKEAKYLEFSGNLALEKLPKLAKESTVDVALVFVVEYRVLIGVEKNADQNKGVLSALADVLVNGQLTRKEEEREGVSKNVVVGWGVWKPSSGAMGNLRGADATYKMALNLKDTPPGVNAFVYSCRPNEQSVNNPSTKHTQHETDGVVDHDDPVNLSFCFEIGEGAGKSHVHVRRPHSPSRSPTTVPLPLPETVQEQVIESPRESPIPNSNQELLELETDPSSSALVDNVPFPPVSPPTSHQPLIGISRAARARLLNANFPPLPLDEKNQKPVPVMSMKTINMGLETNDVLKCNEITITVMGITFQKAARCILGDRIPEGVFFTFQFYNFPYTASERFHLHTGDLPSSNKFAAASPSLHRSASMPGGNHIRQMSQQSHRSLAVGEDGAHVDGQRRSSRREEEELGSGNEQWPGILYSIGGDGKPLFSSYPGLHVKYLVDPNFDVSTDPNDATGGRSFLTYLCEKSLCIDVWDNESLLQIGSCSVRLGHMLRQGRGGVVYIEDVDLVYHEMYDNETSGTPNGNMPTSSSYHSLNTARNEGQSPIMRSVVIGKVHLTITNIGRPDPSSITAGLGPEGSGVTKYMGIRRRPVIIYDYREALKGARTIRKVLAKKMIEVDAELVDVLRSNKNKISSRVTAEGEENIPPSDYNVNHLLTFKKPTTYKEQRGDRSRDLQTIQMFRDKIREQTIVKSLCENITTQHTIDVSFGKAHFFEFVFTNPYLAEHVFEVSFDDSELRVVTHQPEWKYLRRIHGIRASSIGSGLADKPLHIRADGVLEMFLLASEVASIPFVYQSFLSGPVCRENSTGHNLRSTLKDGIFSTGIGADWSGPGIASRKIEIAILNRQKRLVAQLRVQVNPCQYPVERTYRYYKAENEIFRKSIQFSPMSTQAATVYDTGKPNEKYAMCSNDEAVCTLKEKPINTNLSEINIKYQCKAAPSVGTFYVLFYDDPFHTSLCEVWRFFIHSLRRVDVHCILGQTSSASLVVRGLSSSRTVQCYTSYPRELQVNPAQPFVLTANSLNEIKLLMLSKTVGRKDILLNIVDNDHTQLISSWLVATHCSSPVITKAFELNLPIGQSINKRVSFTNPYSSRRTFHLCTNRDDLVQFRNVTLELDTGETQYIGMRFTPAMASGTVEVLVFVNNAEGKNEECMSITARYKQTGVA